MAAEPGVKFYVGDVPTNTQEVYRHALNVAAQSEYDVERGLALTIMALTQEVERRERRRWWQRR